MGNAMSDNLFTVESSTNNRSVLITVRLRTAAEFPGVTFISMRRYGLEATAPPESAEASNPPSALSVLEAWLTDSDSSTHQ